MKKIWLSALALCLVSAPASAGSWMVCDGSERIIWDENSTAARINTRSFPAGTILQTAQRAIDITNTNPSRFTINRTTETGSVGRGNGQNEVYAANITPPGVARMNVHCYWFEGLHAGLDEVDIVLDSELTWTTTQNKASLSNYGGSGRPIEPVIVHESGHYLGLMHVDWEYNALGDAWRHHHTNGSTTHSYFGEDASRTARTLYGSQSSPFGDLSVSHWRYTGSDGEYSTHARTRADSPGISNLSSYTINNEPGYRANLGQDIQLEFTIENNGKNTQNDVTYGLYVSTNDYISLFDTRIGGGRYRSIHPADVATHIFDVRVPDNLERGRAYWFGIIIDEDNSVDEISGLNNATYIPIWIN